MPYRDPRIDIELVTLIAALNPSMDRQLVQQSVLTAVPGGPGRTKILRHMTRFPDALRSGDTRAPMGVQRLIRILHSVGARDLRVPRCRTCDSRKPLPRIIDDAGHRCCERCAETRGRKPCDRCGVVALIIRRIGGKGSSGPGLCRPCYRRDPISRKTCIVCGQFRHCDERTEAGSLCYQCAAGKPVECGHCHQRHKKATTWLDKPICNTCFKRARRTTAVCPGCGGQKVLAFYDPHRRTVCAACAGLDPSRYACTTCGSAEHWYGKRCAQCVLTERVTTVLTGRDGRICTRLWPLRDLLLVVDIPASTLKWLSTSEAARLLHDMATDVLPINHTTLDELPHTGVIDYLRALLITADVLPAREEILERFSPWLNTFLATHAEHARVLRPYATWHLQRTMRAKSRAGTLLPGSAQNARSQLHTAAAFLTWLTNQDTTLTQATQRDLDAFLTEHPTRRQGLPGFLTWAGKHQLTNLTPPVIPHYTGPTTTLTDANRWATAEQLLHNDNLPIDVRLAGLFVLLYGQTLTRVLRLRTQDITTDTDGTRIRLGTTTIVLPQQLATLLEQQRNRRGKASYNPRHGPWLFPGGHPGQPINAGSFATDRLNPAGIYINPSRTAALMHLAAEIPAPVLADLLGLNPTTAAFWATHAKRDWTQYTATRARNQTNE